MDQPEQIGARLRRLREALGFSTAKEFAQFLDIDHTAWNHFERGRRAPLPADAVKVCAKTGVSLDWIYRGMEHTLPLHIVQKLHEVPEPEMKPLKPRREPKPKAPKARLVSNG